MKYNKKYIFGIKDEYQHFFQKDDVEEVKEKTEEAEETESKVD